MIRQARPRHEHAAFALHSPICSQIRLGVVRRSVDLAAGSSSRRRCDEGEDVAAPARSMAGLALALSACSRRDAAVRRAKRRPTALNVVLDQATIMKLPEKVATIVVGNPLIADVAVQSGGLVVVTGKGYGVDQPHRARPRRRGADGAFDRGAAARRTRRFRSIAASSARPIAARRIASAASRSATPPTTSPRRSASPVYATARRSGAGGSPRPSADLLRLASAALRPRDRAWLAKRKRRARACRSIQATIRQRAFAKHQPGQAYRLTAVPRAPFRRSGAATS